MNTSVTFAIVALITLLSLAATAGARSWTEASSGRAFEGDFVSVEDGKVTIKRADGKTFSVELSRLSDADKEFVESQNAPAPTEGGEELVDGDEVIISDVHLCCGGCTKDVEKALGEIEDIEFSVSRSSGGKVTITSSSSSKMEDALEALAGAGYYGKSNHKTYRMAEIEADDGETDSVEVSGVHLCCGKCVSAVDDAVQAVEGASGHDAEKGSETFVVKGEGISPAGVLAALRAEGLNGDVK